MINSPLLPKISGYIGGNWAQARSGGTMPVTNRATGEHLADVPCMGEAEAASAVEAAATSQRTVSPPPQERREWLLALHQSLLENKAELARIITLEHGKPLKESQVEVEYAAGFQKFFAEQLKHLEAETLPEAIRNCRWVIHHRPAGVAGLITPWNFPLAMLAKKIAPALAAGCSVVLKPASITPLITIAVAGLFERIGLPTGRFNLVIGRAGPIAKVLCSHPAVRLISFTGSTEVGSELIRNTAPHVKRLSMELGGNAPFFVFEDADLAAAADQLMANKFRAGGQTCVCANRVYVHERIAAEFTEAMAERVRKLRVGDGLDPATDIGPLINRDAFDKVREHVQDALARGAERVVGDDPPRPQHDWGAFYPPTLLTGIEPNMRITQEETFGPVLPLATFKDEESVIEAANSTPFGLAAYVFTSDAERAKRVLPQVRFGHVGLNTGTGPTPEAPFGGMKQSGFGREGGVEGLLEFCETQTVAAAG
jgi:succinate-semialdehyde dehydrogenase/glutarate-semialdehyde dehydrogenase